MRKFSPQHLRSWMAAWSDQLHEVAHLGSDKLEYPADAREEVRSEACRLAGARDDALLRRRMLAMGLDPDELAHSDPALFRHLRKCCAHCQSPQDCALDLAHASTSQIWSGRDDWQDYCENVLALEMLIALRTRARPLPRSD